VNKYKKLALAGFLAVMIVFSCIENIDSVMGAKVPVTPPATPPTASPRPTKVPVTPPVTPPFETPKPSATPTASI
jgi:hypothetical protein